MQTRRNCVSVAAALRAEQGLYKQILRVIVSQREAKRAKGNQTVSNREPERASKSQRVPQRGPAKEPQGARERFALLQPPRGCKGMHLFRL